VLALASCHLVFQHAPPGEAPVAGDARRADRGGDSRTDGGSFDSRRDGVRDHIVCAEPTEIHGPGVDCDKQAVSPSGDADGDGLLDAIDPDVGGGNSTCNLLLAKEEFAGASSSFVGTGASPECGQLRLAAGSTIQAGAPFLGAAQGSPKIVIEVKLRPLVATDGLWSATIEVEDANGLVVTCDARRTGADSSRIMVMRSDDPTHPGMASPITPGTEYRLLYYYAGWLGGCRVMADSGFARPIDANFKAGPPTAIRIRAETCDLEIDHVRMFGKS
jgi:hypothetical protein